MPQSTTVGNLRSLCALRTNIPESELRIGFAGKHLSDDLYLRWIQLGAFQPILRLHSDHGDRLPWEYDSSVSGAMAPKPAQFTTTSSEPNASQAARIALST